MFVIKIVVFYEKIPIGKSSPTVKLKNIMLM